MWQNINLSGLGQSDDGRRTGSLTTLGPCPALPLVHLGEWPTWPRPGKWHKWAWQPVIYHWYYFQGPFAVLYLHHLITYSWTKCREMLYRLLSLQTNLLISFHSQSDVSLHQGTTCEELLLSSQTRNAMEKVWPKVNLIKVIIHLAMRCPLGGCGVKGAGVYLSKGQPDPQAN